MNNDFLKTVTHVNTLIEGGNTYWKWEYLLRIFTIWALSCCTIFVMFPEILMVPHLSKFNYFFKKSLHYALENLFWKKREKNPQANDIQN